VTIPNGNLHVAPPPPQEEGPVSNPPLYGIFRNVSGPDTTGPEIAVQVAGIVALTAAAVALAVLRDPRWSALQWVIAVAIAFDFSGGVVTNATTAAKRWFHRPGRGAKRAAFYVAHAHPLLIAWAFSTPWTQAIALYAGMLGAVAVVERVPREIAQPAAFGAVALGLIVAGAGTWPVGLEWFAPVYLLKLVGAHAVPAQD
jgi:hypothetical protein